MDIQEIKQLIKLVEKSEVGEIELVEEGRKIRISKNSKLHSSPRAANGMSQPIYVQAPAQAPPQTLPEETTDQSAAQSPPAPPPAEAPVSEKYYEVRSPMVGTFYRSPAPDAEPYVDVGSTVSPGSTLCIIEAMKLMNEIQSDYSGRIAKINVENGQPVEFDQVLFLIETEK